MVARWSGLLLVIALTGCTQVVDTPPKATPPVAPITAGQVGDLLSPSVEKYDGNLFSTVEPEDCSGVAKEVDPPFIFEFDPAATDGGHWMVDDLGRQVYIEEMVGVYRADYDAKNALAQAKRTLQSCQDVPITVTDMKGRSYDFTLLPPVTSDSPNILLWSLQRQGLGLRQYVRRRPQRGGRDFDVRAGRWLSGGHPGQRCVESH